MYYSKPVQPLPAGWEAKYDPTNRKWFYINHVTKTTQWEDPRLTFQQSSYGASPKPQFAKAAAPQKQVPATTSFIDAEPEKVNELIKNYGVDPELAKSMLRTHMNNMPAVDRALKDMGFTKKMQKPPSPKVAQPDPHKVSALIQDFGISEALAKSILRTHVNNMDSAVTALRDMGYKKKTQTPSSSSLEPDAEKVTLIVDQYGVSESLAKSVLRNHGNDMNQAASALNDMGYQKRPEAKQHFVNLLKSEYNKAPIRVIKAELMKTKNSVQGARLGLESLGYVKQRNEPNLKSALFSKAESKPASAQKKSPKPVVDVEKAKRELKKKFPHFDDSTLTICLKVAQNDVEMATKILEAKQEKDKRESRAAEERDVAPSTSKTTEVEEEPRDFAPKVFGEEPSTSSLPSELPTTTSFTPFELPTSSASRADSHEPKVFEKAMSTTPVMRKKEKYVPVKKVYRKQQRNQVSGYKSSLRIEPMGANPELCKGPDPTLLLQTYAERLGPNQANRVGPLRSNRCGPNAHNHVGPANLAEGPAGIMV